MRHLRLSAPLAAIILIACLPALAQFNVLYNLGQGGTDPCQPGSEMEGVLAQGQDGNMYGTAPTCGANDFGGVFKVTPAGTFTTLYSFGGPGHDGTPFGGLTLGADGDFYGTSDGGGTSGDGTIFKITATGTPTTLYSFTGLDDGFQPLGPPIQGVDGNFYGTAKIGGNYTACGNGCGTVYKMTPAGAFTTLHQFDLTHGDQPNAPLVQGTDGNFYGTTFYGGTSGGFGSGVVFKITATGTLTVLHNFCSQPACADGQNPAGPLVQGKDGNFYGTTITGGTNGVGAVFKMTPAGKLTVLHSMTAATDGYNPYAGLVQASDGNFYGADTFGGSHGDGTFFKITPTGTFLVLNNFDGTAGANPHFTPLQHTSGIVYGDTQQGGTGSEGNCSAGTCGVIYSYNGGFHSFIKLMPGSGKVGSQIGILGQGFTNSSVVKFNGIKATSVTFVGSEFLFATVPAGTLDGLVTVTTGTTTLKSLQKFLVHDSWGSGTPLPTALRYPAGTGVIGGKIYVVGGTTTGSALIATNQVYNPATNKWTTAASLPTALTDGAGAVVNGILYVIGGYNGTNVVNTVYAYNPSTNIWTSKAPMPTARASIGAALEKGLIYVVGGVNGDGHTRLNTVEAFDPATDTWTTEAPLLVGKSEVSVGLVGSTIVAAGGFTTSGDTGDNEGYNAKTNTWKSLASDPTARHDSCAAAINGLLYVAGGGLSPINTNESFSVTGNNWTALSPLPKATTAPGQATVNGQLFCIGGGDSTAPTGGNFYNDVQIYQP